MNQQKMAGRAKGKQRILKVSLHDHVVDALREMIVTGELKGGERIVEQELSETLGVSRTPIREAIKTLTIDGLVDSPVHLGAHVKTLEPQEVKELFEVIAVIEALAAECVAKKVTDSELKKLETKHNRMQGHFDGNDRGAYFRLNSEIHMTIVELSENKVIFDTHKRLMLRASRGRYMAILDDARWQEAMNEHEDLMEAFRNRDPDTAFKVWRNHLMQTGQAVLSALKYAAYGPD